MIKNVNTLIFLFIALFSCGQNSSSTNIKGLIIDPIIKNKVEKYIRPSKELSGIDKEMQLYENSFLGEYYENDKLEISSDDSSKK